MSTNNKIDYRQGFQGELAKIRTGRILFEVR